MLRGMQPLSLESILPHLWISGRASRQEWWRVHFLCAIAAAIDDHMFFSQLRAGAGFQLPGLWLVFTAILLWISFASVVRRLHDRGKSGWWSLLYLLPGIGWLWLIIECGVLPARAPARETAAPAAFAPQAAPQRSRRASRPPLSAAPGAGTIQRVEYRPWTFDRFVRLTGNAIGAIVVGFVLYKVFFDAGSLPVFELHPMQPERAE